MSRPTSADHKNNSLALQAWLHENGGFLHQNISIAFDSSAGWHWEAHANIVPKTPLCTVPHSLTLSYINALVDEKWPIFKASRSKLKIENIGFWYLAVQYVNKETSFWKPYFDCLPRPEHGHSTPLFLDSDEDFAWLETTDVSHTAVKRNAIYREYYEAGISVLQSAGIDTAPYTWDLFRWAVTMFTSRSFSSRALRPDSKYWAAYKTGNAGRREAVLLDFSHVPADDLDFPVLFPVLDVPNHRNNAHVDWSFDPGRFSLSTNQSLEPGNEVYNNYGAKGNDEFLLGYGFCIPDNRNDRILLTLKPPPEGLQERLMEVHPGYFSPECQWKSDKATFRVFGPIIADFTAESIFEQLPGPLLELLIYYLRHERGYEFRFIENPVGYITSPDKEGRPRYQPFLARMLVESLMPKLAKLNATHPSFEPQNERQQQAKIYRDGQIKILHTAINGLKTFTRSLRPESDTLAKASGLVTLEDLLATWAQVGPDTYEEFMECIARNVGTDDAMQLIAAGWEEDIWVLAICYIYKSKINQKGVLSRWIEELVLDYGDPDHGLQGVAGEKGQELMELVDHAITASSSALAGTHWMTGWSAQFLELFGGRILRNESMLMMLPDGYDGERPRIVVYLHGWAPPDNQG
ncbi:hypothetical protein MBLNU230_g4348t1 [Neophaeotheca triangularis]